MTGNDIKVLQGVEIISIDTIYKYVREELEGS